MLMVFAFSLTACSGTAAPSAEKDSVTIQEWLDNEGSEADTIMAVTIVTIENPVWALVTLLVRRRERRSKSSGILFFRIDVCNV